MCLCFHFGFLFFSVWFCVFSPLFLVFSLIFFFFPCSLVFWPIFCFQLELFCEFSPWFFFFSLIFFFLIHAIWFSHHFSAFSLCCFASVFHVTIQVAAAWLSSLQSAVFQNLLWGQHFPPLCDWSVMALFFPQKDCPGETIHSAMQKCPSLIYSIIQVWKQCSLYILVYKGKNGSYVMMFPVLCFLYQCV